MTFAQMTLPEFDHEMATTRKLLERIPEDKLAWKAHAKSNTIGWNACHLAEIPGWGANILTESHFDMNPTGNDPYTTPDLTSRKAILDFFDTNVALCRKAMAAVADADIMAPWQLRDHGSVILEMPRCRLPNVDPQPHHPPPRHSQRLLPPQRHPGSCDLRAVGRRAGMNLRTSASAPSPALTPAA